MLVFLTFALVIITGFYAVVTYRILRANEKVVEVMHQQVDSLTRPYICVSLFLEPDNPIFYLKISNNGKTNAEKLKLTIDKSFHQFGNESIDRDISTYTVFNKIIESFHPGEEIVISLAQSFKIFDKNADKGLLPRSFTITAEYSYCKKEVKENSIIDLEPYSMTNEPQDPNIRKLAKINESINKIADILQKNIN